MAAKLAVNIVIAGGDQDSLRECLRSLAASSYAPCRTLVVDNSPSGLAGLMAAFPRVEVARPARPLTFAAAVNLGFRSAAAMGARLFFLLNDDVAVDADSLALLSAAEGAGGPGVYAPEVWPWEAASGARRRFRIDWAKRLVVGHEASPSGPMTRIDYAEASAVLISATVVERAGGFDEWFGFYYEDADFSLRAADAGFPVVEVAGALVRHKGSASAGKGLSPFKAYYRARNTMRFAWKHRRRARVASNAAYHIFGFVLPQTLRASGRALMGSRQDARVAGAILLGTWDFLTGGTRAYGLRK